MRALTRSIRRKLKRGDRPDTVSDEDDTKVVCVDKKRQWSKWRNVWHSSAIHSTLYTMGAPGRVVKRRFKRDRAVV